MVASTLHHAPGRERRHDPRLGAHQRAYVLTDGDEKIPAEIRDYCDHGLHLFFLHPDALGGMSAPLVGGRAEVELGAGAAAIRLAGRIVHVSSDDLGLYLESMPATALDMLRGSVRPVSASNPQRPLGAEALREECARHFSDFQSAVMEDFFGRVGKVLSDARDEAVSIAEQVDLRYAGQVLSQQASRIREDFIHMTSERFEHVRKVDSMPGGGGMSLVGQDEFEDWLNLSGVINRLEADFHEELNDLEARFGQLIGQHVDGKSDPFAPAALCRAFQTSIQSIDLSNAMRVRFYATFGQVLVRRYPPLFERLAKTLASIQPRLEPSHALPHEHLAAHEGGHEAASSPVSVPGATDMEPMERSSVTSAASAYLPPQSVMNAPEASPSAGYSLDVVLAMLNRANAASMPTLPSMPFVTRGGGALGGESASVPLMRVAGSLRERLPSAGAAIPPVEGVSAEALAAMPVAGVGDVLTVLEQGPASGRGEPAVSWLQHVGRQLAALPGGGMRLDARTGQVLGVMAELLERAVSQYAPSSEIELLVKKLEPSLLKLALTDEGFLDRDDHPARRVVNLLDQFSMAADDKGKLFDPKLRIFLNQLVERLRSQESPDAALYETVAGTLQKILDPIRQHRRLRIARLQEASEGRERIRTARARVAEALGSLLAGRHAPDILLSLLDGGWQNYLTLLELRRGAEGEAWKQALSVVERLRVWFEPGFQPGEGFAREARDLIALVEREMATVDVDPSHLRAILDELESRLLGEDGPRSASTALIPEDHFSTGRAQQEGMARRHARLIERLRLGIWWDLMIDGLWTPMQLIWMSQPVAGCAFANRSATQKVECSLDELAQRLASNTAREGDNQNQPLLERSEHAMVDDAYHRLRDQAIHDAATGLLNRKGFIHRLQALASEPESRNVVHTLAQFEFDTFRMIYTRHGLEEGERYSRVIGESLQGLMPPGAVAAAFGDETLLVLMPRFDQGHAYEWAHEAIQSFKAFRFETGEEIYSVGVNIGLAEFEPLELDAGEVIRRADEACQAAKQEGRNHIQVFESAQTVLLGEHSLMEWASRIDNMLENDGLYLRFQLVMPIRNYSSLKPYYEILLGVHGLGDEGDLAPQGFILAVEQLRRVHEIDMWVLGKVFAWIRANHRLFDTIGGFSMNLSAQSLKSPELLAFLHQHLGAGDIDPQKLIFEITETVAIDSYNTAQDFIQQVRRYGCKFSIDDFGSGHASYVHLKDLRADVLKIDGYFVRDLADSETDYVMVRSMNEIAHSLGMRTVAEYVESRAILDKLRDVGVDYAQGFVIHKPIPIEQLGSGMPGSGEHPV
ncbi:MAG: DUF1631 family protein [Pseudomonadota bacterium]